MKEKILIKTAKTSLLIVIILFLGCETREKFYREKELFHFLEENKINIPNNNTIIFLLVGSSCETCIDATKEILKLRNTINPAYTIAILGDELADKEYSKFIQNDQNTVLFKTNINELASRGLLLQGDGIFFISGSKKILKLWSMTYQNKPMIIKELKKRKYLRI